MKFEIGIVLIGVMLIGIIALFLGVMEVETSEVETSEQRRLTGKYTAHKEVEMEKSMTADKEMPKAKFRAGEVLHVDFTGLATEVSYNEAREEYLYTARIGDRIVQVRGIPESVINGEQKGGGE